MCLNSVSYRPNRDYSYRIAGYDIVSIIWGKFSVEMLWKSEYHFYHTLSRFSHDTKEGGRSTMC